MTDGREPAPAWLRDVLGPGLARPRRLQWGFTHESWTAIVGGRQLVATRMTDAAVARTIVARGPELARRLAGAGITSPEPDISLSRPGLGVVVTAFVEGPPAIELMAGEAGARLVGGIAGDAWVKLRGVDPLSLGLDDLWARPADLRDSAAGWLAGVASDLTPDQRSVLQDRIGAIEPLLEGRRPGFVHGDLVPVNVLVRGGALSGLLDLEGAHVGEPLLDAAWFSWILRYHHPEIERAASEAFARHAGLSTTDGRTAALLAVLASIRILEMAGRPNAASVDREHWLRQLRVNAGV